MAGQPKKRARLRAEAEARGEIVRVARPPMPMISPHATLDERRDSIIAMIAAGHSLRSSAAYCGVPIGTAVAWNANDEDFSARVEHAKAIGEGVLIERLHDPMPDGVVSTNARWLLSRQHRGYAAEAHVEHSGRVDSVVTNREEDRDTLLAYAAEIAKAHALAPPRPGAVFSDDAHEARGAVVYGAALVALREADVDDEALYEPEDDPRD